MSKSQKPEDEKPSVEKQEQQAPQANTVTIGENGEIIDEQIHDQASYDQHKENFQPPKAQSEEQSQEKPNVENRSDFHGASISSGDKKD